MLTYIGLIGLNTPLKECPFCHCIPVIVKSPLWNGSHGYRDNYEYYVSCRNKKCKINPRTKPYDDIYYLEDENCINKAVKDWNKR